jgi:Bifunctional DNA primase/polymerase, N-terminal
MVHVNKGTVMIESLPRFACNGDKRPLTQRGFYDARVDADHSSWPLVGVATGAISGLDVLDIDPEGRDWYRLNFDALPSTRTHQTRRGLHLLFKHASGLRGSSGRIAKGVDVRATGNYAIWWPEAGLPFEDNPITDWPGWLLDLALPTPGAHRSRADGIIDHWATAAAAGDGPGAMGLACAPNGVGVKTKTLNFRFRSKSILRQVEYAQLGNRNNTLHWAACRFGEMVTEGLVNPDIAGLVLESAARVCGLWRDDGIDRVRATIRSGLAAGMENQNE